MAEDFMTSLGQGLRAAAGSMSEHVYDTQIKQDELAAQARAAQLAKTAATNDAKAKLIIEGMQNGSIDPAQGRAMLAQLGSPLAGVPVGLNEMAQTRAAALKTAADTAQRQSDLGESLSSLRDIAASSPTYADASGTQVPITPEQMQGMAQDVTMKLGTEAQKAATIKEMTTPKAPRADTTNQVILKNNNIGVLDRTTGKVVDTGVAARDTSAQMRISLGGAGGASTAEDMDTTAKAIANNEKAWPSGYELRAAGINPTTLFAKVKKENPEYNQMDFKNIATSEAKFTGGTTGNTIRSIGTAERHLDTMLELSKALDTTDSTVLNRARAMYLEQTGSELPTNLRDAARIVGAEVTKGIVGASGGVEERAAAAQAFSEAKSGAQIRGAVDTMRKLLDGQKRGLFTQYKASTKKGKNFTMADFDQKMYDAGVTSEGTPSPTTPTPPAGFTVHGVSPKAAAPALPAGFTPI